MPTGTPNKKGPTVALTQQARTDIARLLEQMGKNIEQALQSEVSVSTDAIKDKLLAEKGHPRNADNLTFERNRLKNMLREIDFDEDERIQELEADASTQSDLEDVAIELVRTWYAKAQQRLVEMRDKRIHLAKAKAEDVTRTTKSLIELRKRAMIEEAFPGMLEMLDAIDKELPVVQKLERQLYSEIERRADTIEKSRARLISLVHDAVVVAKAKLIKCVDAEEAYALTSSIPSVAELIGMLENSDTNEGMRQLVNRLVPGTTLALTSGRAAKPENAAENEKEDELDRVISVRQTTGDIIFAEEEEDEVEN